MAVTWPSTLPKTFEQSSFSDTPQSGVISTEMATGPVKLRKRFTAVSDYWSGTMVVTEAQRQTFITFWKSSLAFGSLNVDFPNQYDAGATTKEARFRGAYTISPDGGTLDWRLSFELEVLP